MLCFHGPLLYEAKVQNPFSFKKLVETTGLIIRFQWWVALVRATFFVDFQVHSSSSSLYWCLTACWVGHIQHPAIHVTDLLKASSWKMFEWKGRGLTMEAK